jgi:hypothetical protein
MDDMTAAQVALQLLVTTVALLLVFYIGYVTGYRKGHGQRLEDLRKNARQRANQAQAELDVLNAVSPPRVRKARVAGTSRRGLKD